MAKHRQQNIRQTTPLTSKAEQSKGKDTASKPSGGKKISPRTLTALSMLMFGLVVFMLLLTDYSTYMRKVEALSLFMGTKMYFDECMTVPGGVVYWLSSMLTQFFYWPWAGALILVILSLMLQWMAIKAFKIPWRFAPLTVLLPALVVAAFINLGYLIFTLRPGGHILSLPVGLICSMGLFSLYRSIPNLLLRVILLAVVIVFGYSYLGFYALLAGVMCGVYHLVRKKDGRWRLIPLALAALLVIVVPRLWFRYIGGNLMEELTYLSGLPYFYANEWGWWTLYGVIFFLLVLGALLTDTDMHISFNPLAVSGGWAVIVLVMVLTRYSDANFKLTLQLDRAIWDQDWDRAISIAEKHQGPTTRVNTLLAYIPLLRTGQAPDRMFAMPYGAEPYNTSRDTRPMHDSAGALVAYHLGLINYASRWGMEYTIGHCQSAERLMILAKCALLNYELPLAKSYLEILYNTPMHREWAKRYMRYVNHPMEMNVDPEMAAIKQLMCQESRFINDGGAFENYIWPLLAHNTQGTPQFDDLSMQAALVMRDLDTFMAKLSERQGDTGKMPMQHIGRHYQEAALLWSVMGGHPSPVDIDPMIQQRHQMFLNSFRATSHMEAEQQREVMRKDFGDTYWFYYIFTEDMQMI